MTIINTDRGTYDLSKREDVYRYFCQNFGMKGDDLSLLERFLIKDYADLERKLSVAKDCLEQCADQGHIMPGEYDTFLEMIRK